MGKVVFPHEMNPHKKIHPIYNPGMKKNVGISREGDC